MKYLYKLLVSAAMLILSLGIIQPAFAQQATESVGEWQKVDHPVFTITYAYPPEIVEGALVEKLQKDHIAASQRKHTIICKGVVYPVLSPSPLDLYFEMEGKSRRRRNTRLNLFISKGRDNFIGKKYDEELARNALIFLDHFQDDVAYYALRKDIYEKEKALEDIRKDYKKLLDDKHDLQKELFKWKDELSAAISDKDSKKAGRKIDKTNKKIRRTEKDIRKTERTIEQRKREIQALRTRLSDWKK